jgi:hypothetical protein
VTKLADEELVQMQLHKNDWFVRRARLELQRRAGAGKLSPAARAGLRTILDKNTDATRRLRALWALHVTGGVGPEKLAELMAKDKEAYVRGWAVQLALEPGNPSDALLQTLAGLARWDPSAVSRLYLASALQRLPLDKRWPIATELAANPDNADDQNLPLMIWYGIEPAIATDRERAVALLLKAKVPLVREYVARRLASAPKQVPVAAAATPATPAAEPSKSAKPAIPTLADPEKTDKGK